MSVYNIYFSPTGGTKIISDTVAAAMAEKFESTDLFKKDAQGLEFKKDDVCIIAVPSFGGRVPQNASEKIKHLKADGAKAVLITSFGNRAIDDTMAELSDLVTSAGFKVVAGIEAVAEHSLARIYATGRPDENDKAQLEAFAEKIKARLEKGDCSTPDLPGNRPYKELKTAAMKPDVADNCVNCKKCARECPVEAISFDNVKEIDSSKCFSCMHCVAACPTGARKNAPELTKAFEERLRERCADDKPNKLYL